MDSRKYLVILLTLACIAIFVAGCTTTTTVGTPAPAQTAATPAPAAVATNAATAPAAAATVVPITTTPECPDKLVWNGNWDSREVGYASNHDVRDANVWTEAGPVPVSLTQKCWDVTGTYKIGDCEDAKLTGRIEKNTLSGTYIEQCEVGQNNLKGTFSLTMAADNQSFMGSKYGYYGPEANFPPSWWGKKIA